LAETRTERSALWLTSKVSPQNSQRLAEHCDKSLDRLKVDHLDLYLLHAPFGVDIPAAWREMEKLVDAGKCRYIGVSNFRKEDIELLLTGARIRPLCNQIEHHPHLQQPELVQYLVKNGIAVTAYSPLAPLTKVDEPTTLKKVLAKIGQKLHIPESEVLLRWNLQQGNLKKIGDRWVLTTTRSTEKCPALLAVAHAAPLDAADAAAISAAGAERSLRCYWTKQFDSNPSS
jgi:diketogulonate reductase-like aldo/keto reductase